MSDFIKSIPVTSDMVSLWIPSGTGRAMDIIRGNHGQCHGTHPNVLVQPNLVNPSLGFSLDGTDDFVDMGNNIAFNSWSTLNVWFNTNEITATSQIIVSVWGDINNRWAVNVDSDEGVGDLFFYVTGSGWKDFGSINIGQWYMATVTEDSGTFSLYLDGQYVQSFSDAFGSGSTYPLIFGEWSTHLDDRFFNGYICFPFIAKSAWSAQQVNNFYLATRDFFQPRG